MRRWNHIESAFALLGRLAICTAVTLILQSSSRAADPFENLNAAFLQQHAEAREREWARHGPVILVEFDKLTLFNGDERKSADGIPPRYHRLKSVTHAPIAIYLLLESAADAPLDNRQRTQLQDMAARLEAVRPALVAADFSPDTLKRQSALLDQSAAFIANTLKTGSPGANGLKAFAANVRPLIDKNIEEAAELQIRAYDTQVAQWQQALPNLDWGKLKVVITGSALPRKHNLATQYFARLLGVSGECPRLVYAEGLYEEARALKLLNATAVDARAGTAFFDDPSYLHRDLMAAAAAKYLREHSADLRAATRPGQP
jgi:hypothetical protein